MFLFYHFSSSSPRTPKKGHSKIDMELEDFSPPKASQKEAAINEAEFNEAGSTNGQVGEYFISINEHRKGLRFEPSPTAFCSYKLLNSA